MILKELSANDKVLELGGGDKPVCPGRWSNLDCRELPGVDIVADLNEPLPVESESYDGVFSSYLIEHLSWRKVRGLISEVYRVLKTGGKAVFITANLLEQAKKLAGTPEWNDELVCMIFGDQNYEGGDWIFNAHHCGFSPDYAVKLFNEAGFRTEVKLHPDCKTDMVIVATKPPLRLPTWVKKTVDEIKKDKPDARIIDLATQPDITNLPFSNKAFDVAVCIELLQKESDPVGVLREIKRVSKKALVSVPDEYSWETGLRPFQNLAHLRHYTEGMLRQHLGEAKIKDYSLGKLDYDGWSFFAVVADLGEVSTAKRKAKTAIGETIGETIFDKPEYWCGELGYRPDPNGIGYQDFPINQVKVDYILRKLQQKVEGEIHEV